MKCHVVCVTFMCEVCACQLAHMMSREDSTKRSRLFTLKTKFVLSNKFDSIYFFGGYFWGKVFPKNLPWEIRQSSSYQRGLALFFATSTKQRQFEL